MKKRLLGLLTVLTLGAFALAAGENLLPAKLGCSAGKFADGVYTSDADGRETVFFGEAKLDQKEPETFTFGLEYRLEGAAKPRMYVNLVYMDGSKRFAVGRFDGGAAKEFTPCVFTHKPEKPVRLARFHIKYSGSGVFSCRKPFLRITPGAAPTPTPAKPAKTAKPGKKTARPAVPAQDMSALCPPRPIDAGGTAIDLAGQTGNGVYRFSVPRDGEYDFVMRTASRSHEIHIRAKFQIDDARPRTRVIFSYIRSKLWDPLLRVELKAGPHTLKITEFAKDVEIKLLKIYPVSERAGAKMPAVPEAVKNYVPPVVPRPDHPRVLLNKEIIARLRKNLDKPETAAEWNNFVKPYAMNGLVPVRDKDGRPVYSFKFLRSVECAALYSLVMNDPELGKKAADAIFDYFSNIDFDNLVLTSRHIGASIWTTAIVYDWCYDYLTKEQKDELRKKMLFYAQFTEPRWPPFRQPSVIKGHGNESQMMRDLPGMAIAIYNEDPTPWKYIAYRYFEELAPGHKFEFASGRHSQGSNYGWTRFSGDLCANLLVKSATGKQLLDDNFRRVPYFFIHLYQPNLEYFDLCDVWLARGKPNASWEVMSAAAANMPEDPYIKSERYRTEKVRNRRISPDFNMLLFSDPDLKPRPYTELDLAALYGDPLSSLVARTAWTPDAAAVLMIGVPYKVGDHCHMDAGTWQIYHRERLFTDIGDIAWGVPYDMFYARRTICHSGGMLVRDPDEVNLFGGRNNVDGGEQLKMGAGPRIEDVFKHPENTFTGKLLAQQAFPDTKAPKFCYMKLDLKDAYTAKVRAFVRDMLWVPTGDEKDPAWFFTFDRVEAAKPEFAKAYCLNTYLKPEIAGNAVTARMGQGVATATMLLPEKTVISQFGDGEAQRINGKLIEHHNYAEPRLAKAWRTEVAPAVPSAKDEFLCAVHIGPDPVKPVLTNSGNRRNVRAGKFFVSFAVEPDDGFDFTLDAPAKAVVTGLKPGKYVCGGREFTADANGTWYAELGAGKYAIRNKK